MTRIDRRQIGVGNMQLMSHPEAEWLEADGLGGFASGTVGGFRTRRYHALLLTAVNPVMSKKSDEHEAL